METIILADGKFPSHEIPLKILKNAKKVICCDGATLKLLEYGREPYAIIGDIDSIPADIIVKYKSKIVSIAEQETNDLTKSVNWCVENNLKEIIILGATGLREDHTAGNISLLCNYMKKANVKMISDFGIFTPINKTTKFKSFAGQQISIFSINPETKINSENLKYPLINSQLKSWWQGTLNECNADYFTISFKKGEIIVFQSHKNITC
ncbi:MAG: thiamine diphosphokinase [Bacteroidales bacterium]|nr:thiamine diphosphokinase [Bacteroidales bacterium]